MSKIGIYSKESYELEVLNEPISELSHQSKKSILPEVVLGTDGLPRLPEKDNEMPKNSQDMTLPLGMPQDNYSCEEEGKIDLQTKQSSYFATVMNLLNSLLGAGILGVPNSFINTGIFPSIFLILLMDFLSYVGTRIVIVLQMETHATGFGDLAFRITGKIGSIALSIMSLFYCISTTLAYLVIGGDILVSWFAFGGININSMGKRAALVLVYAVVIPIALTIPRNTRFLAIFSTATVACIIFFNVSMVIECSMFLNKQGISKTVINGRADITLFSSLAIYGLAFALPVVALPILDKFSDVKSKRDGASLWASGLCLLFVFIPGILGYLVFGADTKPNVLQNFPNSNIFFVVVRGAFFLVVSFAYAGVSQSTLSYWSQIIFNTSEQSKLPRLKRILILVISNGIPLLIAMFLANAKPALAVGGAMGGCMADFFFPALFWIINSPEKKYSIKNILCMIFAGFGLITCVISTYRAILDAIVAFSSLGK